LREILTIDEGSVWGFSHIFLLDRKMQISVEMIRNFLLKINFVPRNRRDKKAGGFNTKLFSWFGRHQAPQLLFFHRGHWRRRRRSRLNVG